MSPSPPKHPHRTLPAQKLATTPAPGQPVFAQPQPSPDPTGFKNPVTDQSDKELANVEPVPQPVGSATEPILTLAQGYGSAGAAKTAAIEQAGQIVFHSVGDTGSAKGPTTQSLVADKMVSDFTEANSADIPTFFYHLGDVVYYFGEATYYYDQFYEPYRSYPAPIVAIPGNHDGVVYAADPAPTLAAFPGQFLRTRLRTIARCRRTGAYNHDPAGCLLHLRRALRPYSGRLQQRLGRSRCDLGPEPSLSTMDSRQIDFLQTALGRVKSGNYTGAVIIAVHHPPFTGGSTHGGSPLMLQDIDNACQAAGVWPHAVFSGHSHNYQRFTRTVNGLQVPYVVAGCGGLTRRSRR